jgi:mitochondrial cardiolipin hydrolase
MRTGFLMILSLIVSPGSVAQGKTLDTCFSPLGHCDQVLISWINSSRKSLDGAIYGLTDESIADALVLAHRRGVKVRVVHDKTQAGGKRDVSDILMEAGIPIHIQRGSEGGILHHKFLIIDSSYVVTGSFNWTNNASARNDENFVVLDDQSVIFQAEFDRLWAVSALRKPPPPKKRKPTPARR